MPDSDDDLATREGFTKLATGMAQITELLTNLSRSEDTGEGDAQ